MIKSLNFEIINICNLKCNMCDIWKNKIIERLEINNITDILKSEFIDTNTDITITGGEPLLYIGIEKIFSEVNKLGFKINTLSTNGLLYEKIKNIIDYCIINGFHVPNIHISIDGNEEIHDKQRGINGSFKKSIETIIKIKKEYKNIKIKIKYTITKLNISNIKYVYNLSEKIKTDISYKIVENDKNYTNRLNNPILLDDLEKKEVYKQLFKIYGNNYKYINNLLYYIKNNKLNFECTTPIENLFIMANGNIYTCTKYKSIGNIKNENIKNILGNNIHNEIINEVKNIKCSKCFSLHGAYKSII